MAIDTRNEFERRNDPMTPVSNTDNTALWVIVALVILAAAIYIAYAAYYTDESAPVDYTTGAQMAPVNNATTVNQ